MLLNKTVNITENAAMFWQRLTAVLMMLSLIPTVVCA